MKSPYMMRGCGLILMMLLVIPWLVVGQNFNEVTADPVEYCAKIQGHGSSDKRYSGDMLPKNIVMSIRDQFQFSSQVPLAFVQTQTSWRCVHGKMMACVVGANLPCGKANTTIQPSAAVKDYCSANPDSEFIPAALTGHDSAFQWRCIHGVALIIKELPLDADGFFSDYWQEVKSQK